MLCYMWSMLLITLPTQPNAVRLRTWRALKALGCAALRDGAYLLPAPQVAALDALSAFGGGMQLGGGVNPGNAVGWLEAGASHVIVTSWVFRDGRLDGDRIEELVRLVGRDRLVLDLSCRRRGGTYWVVTDRWQRYTTLDVTPATLEDLSRYCAEFLVHAVDVEGHQSGIDLELVDLLSASSPIPTTYAGGARHLDDLEQVTTRSGGRIDLTIGSALDIFGGTAIRYADCVAFNRRTAGGR